MRDVVEYSPDTGGKYESTRGSDKSHGLTQSRRNEDIQDCAGWGVGSRTVSRRPRTEYKAWWGLALWVVVCVTRLTKPSRGGWPGSRVQAAYLSLRSRFPEERRVVV